MAFQQRTHDHGQTRRTSDVRARRQHASLAKISRFLEGVDYPQSKSDIVAYAYTHGCGRDVLRALEGLPERVYENLTELQADLGRNGAGRALD